MTDSAESEYRMWTGYISFVCIWDRWLAPEDMYRLMAQLRPPLWQIIASSALMLAVIVIIVLPCS